MPVIRGWKTLLGAPASHLSIFAVAEVGQCSSGQLPIKENLKNAKDSHE